MTDKNFVRHFILSLILVQKESVFDLDYKENIEIPNDYLDILEELLEGDKYHSLNYTFNRENISFVFKKFVIEEASNVSGKIITIGENAISDILNDKEISVDEKVKLLMLSEDFFIKCDEKSRLKKLKKTN